MIHAEKLPVRIDTSYMKEEFIAPHKKYRQIQKYAEGLAGTALPYIETLKVLNPEDFISQLPPTLVAAERPSVFILCLPPSELNDPVVTAHVDINRTCGINVYIETHGETTKFYRWDCDTKRSEYVEEFCAEDGDVWLMDTTTPHSVDMVPNKARRMLTFSFSKQAYCDVLSHFPKNTRG